LQLFPAKSALKRPFPGISLFTKRAMFLSSNIKIEVIFS